MTMDAATLHATSLVIDGLNAGGPHREWVPHARDAGLDAFVATIGSMAGARGTMQHLEFVRERVLESADGLLVATRAEEIELAQGAGRTAVVLGVQNTRLIEDEVSLLDTFHALGMRIIQLTYNEANLVGDGCLEPRDAGLTRFGEAVVRRMNRLGLIVDCSHTGKRTTLEAMALSDAPVVFTHTNARAISDTPRNIDDQQIEACARTDGVIGVTAFAAFIKASDPASATLDNFLDHIDHIVHVAGIDHVGIGLDQIETMQHYLTLGVGGDPNRSADRAERVSPASVYSSWGYAPGLESITGLPLITAGLLGRGYAAEDVRKIMGLNWLRVYRAVWGG